MTAGTATLAIWVDIDPADEALFENWHSREHAEERVRCPGWLRGSRFKGVDNPGRYLLFYDAETTAAFESDVYYARLRNPTPLSRAIFPKFRNTWRTVCRVEQRWGMGIGAAVLTLRLGKDEPAPFDALVATDPARVDLLVGQPGVGQAQTTEKELRDTQDRQIERAVLAFYRSVADAHTVRAAHAPLAEVLALRHTLSKGDIC